MKCPIDQTELVMNERQGVEIDYCPTCRGIWLDRGELDKIVERSEQFSKNIREEHPSDSRQSEHGGYDKHGYGRKKGGWLGELFD
jgi:Zn-finger nucleic acid-binding protein